MQFDINMVCFTTMQDIVINSARFRKMRVLDIFRLLAAALLATLSNLGNIPVTTTTKIFPKVLRYKWEAYCKNTMGGVLRYKWEESTDSIPFPQSVGAPKVLRYKWEAYLGGPQSADKKFVRARGPKNWNSEVFDQTRCSRILHVEFALNNRELVKAEVFKKRVFEQTAPLNEGHEGGHFP